MKRTVISLALAAGVLLILSGCPGIGGEALAVPERVNAFMTDIDTPSPVYTDVQSNFSSAMTHYELLDEAGYWEGTFFDPLNQSFTLADMVLDEASNGGFAGGVTYSGTIDGGGYVPGGPFPITFVLVSEDAGLGRVNWLIRYIVVEDSATPVPIEVYW